MALDPSGAAAFVLTSSGISVIPLDTVAAAAAPQVGNNAVVNTANFQAAVAPNGLISIIGRNLGSVASAAVTPLPTALGNVCVTLNNVPLPLPIHLRIIMEALDGLSASMGEDPSKARRDETKSDES